MQTRPKMKQHVHCSWQVFVLTQLNPHLEWLDRSCLQFWQKSEHKKFFPPFFFYILYFSDDENLPPICYSATQFLIYRLGKKKQGGTRGGRGLFFWVGFIKEVQCPPPPPHCLGSWCVRIWWSFSCPVSFKGNHADFLLLRHYSADRLRASK